MKKIIMLLSFIVCILVGCSTCIKTETNLDEVLIVGESYKIEHKIPPIFGTGHEIVTTEEYIIIVEYHGFRHKIKLNDEEVYQIFKDRIGEVVIGAVEVRTYEDGKETEKVISLLPD